MSLDKWDDRFLEVAAVAAKWSKDRNAQVGAVVVDSQGQIAGVGYNGFPKLVEDTADRYEDQETKLEMVVHAEVNAILGAGVRARGASVYVVGKPVCARCAGSLIQAGVKRVVAAQPEPETDGESKWARYGRIACTMMEEAKVEFVSSN
jgi:dCMP deaminase